MIAMYDLIVLPDAEFGTQLTVLLSFKMVEMCMCKGERIWYPLQTVE